jgi:hypothetical protein
MKTLILLNTDLYLKNCKNYILIIIIRFNYQLVNENELTSFLENVPETLSSYASKDNNLFEKVIFEHNLYSLSRVYENVSFGTLEKFLNLDKDKILSLTFKMILEKKINARIDEINDIIFFENGKIIFNYIY